MKRKIIFILMLLNAVAYSIEMLAQSDYMYVVTGNNVNLRVEPSQKAKVIIQVPIGRYVFSKNKKSVKATVGGISGSWIFVKTDISKEVNGKIISFEGWIFDYYLLGSQVDINSKGFERLVEIQLEKNVFEIKDKGDESNSYVYQINSNGTFDVIINGEKKESGFIYKRNSLHVCHSADSGFYFFIEEGYLKILGLNDIFAKPEKVKILSSPKYMVIE